MMTKKHLIPFVISITLFSCVSSKKFKAAQADSAAKLEVVQNGYNKSQADLRDCEDAKAKLQNDNNGLNGKVTDLNRQIDMLKDNNNQALKQLENLSVISSQQEI